MATISQWVSAALGAFTRKASTSVIESIDLNSGDDMHASSLEEVSSTRSLGGGSNIDDARMDEYAKRKVLKVMYMIRELNRKGISARDTSLIEFIDMLRERQYPHVKLIFLPRYLHLSHRYPKSYFLHYFMFFLFYAKYYHQIRASTDVIDSTEVSNHKRYLECIECQIKYLQKNIRKARLESVSL